jgi:hypothetical protein
MGITYENYLWGLPMGLGWRITYGMGEKSFKPQLKLGCG